MKLKIYEDLKQEVLSCKKCDLGCSGLLDGFDPHVMGQGNLDAKFFFIAEAPGKEETKNKEPLTHTGTSGKIFKSVLNHLGLERKDVYISNSVLCRPENNRDPLPFEVIKCENYLIRQLELVKPNLVIAFGRFAAQAMLGYIKITKDHGKIHHSEKFGVDVYPMYHPAYVGAYANAERRKEFKRDVNNLKRILNKYKELDEANNINPCGIAS